MIDMRLPNRSRQATPGSRTRSISTILARRACADCSAIAGPICEA